jgi:choline dehydrogenase
LTSPDPAALARVDHAFLTDPDGHDAAVLSDGVALLRELAAQPGLRELLGREIEPGPVGQAGPEQIGAYFTSHVDKYWHPVGTCAMGRSPEAGAVCDGRGGVHGLEGCSVADCALMPSIPRATTALPAVVIGEQIAAFLL